LGGGHIYNKVADIYTFNKSIIYVYMPRDLENYREWKRKKYWNNREKEISRKRAYRKTLQGKKVLNSYYLKVKDNIEYRARVKVSSAVKRGKLVKGRCEICNLNNVQAHHDDYTKPLEIRWFCKQHHSECHRNSL